ncbi:MAG TPA: nucleotidyltransferase domain-containing protein [Anaerolineae bacterium]
MTTSHSLNVEFEKLLAHLLAACCQYYGARLVSVAVFGSVGRGTPRSDSDVDVLIVVEGLPNGRLRRVAEFRPVEAALAAHLAEARSAGLAPELSPVFKTPAEIEQGSPLLLDMIEDARVLYDRGDFLRQALAGFKARLQRLGARRVWRGSAWYWDLKPDYKPGEVFEL